MPSMRLHKNIIFSSNSAETKMKMDIKSANVHGHLSKNNIYYRRRRKAQHFNLLGGILVFILLVLSSLSLISLSDAAFHQASTHPSTSIGSRVRIQNKSRIRQHSHQQQQHHHHHYHSPSQPLGIFGDPSNNNWSSIRSRSRSRTITRLSAKANNNNNRNDDHENHGNGAKLYFSSSESQNSNNSSGDNNNGKNGNDTPNSSSVISSRLYSSSSSSSSSSGPPSGSSTPSPSAIKSTILPYSYDGEGNVDEDCPDESCLLSFIPDKLYSKWGGGGGAGSSSSPSSSSSYSTQSSTLSSTSTFLFETILNPIVIIPILTPIIAYFTYDDVASAFNTCIDALNYKRTWVPVDGGNYQARIIAPAINGICIPAISILFATLISNTVATLRQRQMDIHTNLNTEAGELRLLSSMVESFPRSMYKMRCYVYLTQYTNRLIGESSDKITFNSVEFQGSTDSEMNGFVNVLNELTSFPSMPASSSATVTTTESSSTEIETETKHIVPPSPILSESYGAVVRLNSLRSSRITSLQSTFPSLHYSILTALAGSICLAFLIETNQELLIFLNAIQLRILWTMLIGTFSALAVVCYDLSGPFRGQYQISNAVYQLMTIRDTLKAAMSLEEDDVEDKER